jgi:hypothetical protein
MFGLVRRSRLIEAEKRVVAVRLQTIRCEEAAQGLVRELAHERTLREAAEAERDRLQAILIAHPVEAAEPAAKAPKAESGQPEPVRVLSAREVVDRAMAHRNLHKVTK